jgi:ribosomal-protein-alanine N-acetyltransferase
MAVAIPRAARSGDGEWTLAELTAQDLPAILEIERLSFTNSWSEALFLQEIKISFSRIIVIRPATDPARPIVGFLCRWFVADEIHVLNVAVHPDHRRRGIGGVLMQEVLREAREVRATAVTLEVRRGNAEARSLYEGLGFEEVGLRRNYYGRGEDAIILRLTLSHA